MQSKPRSKSSKEKRAVRKAVSPSKIARQQAIAEALVKETQSSAAQFKRRLHRMETDVHSVEGNIHRAHLKSESVHRKARKMMGITPRPASGFPIVGIGASAGGLEAMTQLLKNLPRDLESALVLMQHLDPLHESQLTALLSRVTTMEVLEVKDRLRLQPGHLYVVPPNKRLTVSKGRLKLSPRRGDRDSSVSIDLFFSSLAKDQGRAAIGIILSGNGSDGTLGLKAIKAAGGVTFAQKESSAKFSSMPASAIGSRCVDFVLPPENIGRELARLGKRLPGGTEAIPKLKGVPARTEDGAFEDILVILRQRVGVDFTHYKRPTLERRIRRRMAMQRMENVREYASYLRSHSSEARKLFNDFLIHVTDFFRDPPVFTELKKKVFPRLLKGKSPNDPIRIWIPGCSTGEEVYSIAIALLESLSEKNQNVPIQIFGTDINEAALDKARAGTFPESITRTVSAERLRRFFIRQAGGWRVNKSVRALCIFARQNVVTDPPFSNLDLISCRNLLIYLGLPLQRRVMPTFHYALKPTGILLLGTSESVGTFVEMFGSLHAKTRIFFKKSARLHREVTFGTFPPLSSTLKVTSPVAPADLAADATELKKHADRILLSQFSPAAVIINGEMEVLQFRGRTGQFFEHPHGRASFNLLKMAREGIATPLRSAVSMATRQNIRVRKEGAHVRQHGYSLEVAIEVVPFRVAPSREWFYLVLFDATRPLAAGGPPQKQPGEKAGRARSEPEMSRLRAELAETSDSLEAIIEKQETSNEELRSANEEIMSSNEELQSTNEELETAKEEMQSTNEELTTLNEELETRNTEMNHVNDDLQNILASVPLPILIVDRDLRIRRFTAAGEKLFSLIPSDIGRPITDIAMKVKVPDLPSLIMEVIDSLATKEVEALDQAGRYWSVRIRPYKTTNNKIDGALMVLLDVDELKRSLKTSEHQRAFAEAIVNTVRSPLIVLDKTLAVRHVNESFLKTFKVSAAETLRRHIYNLGNGQWSAPQLRKVLEEVLPKNSKFHDFEIVHTFPRIGRRKMLLNARQLQFEDGEESMILLGMETVAVPER